MLLGDCERARAFTQTQTRTVTQADKRHRKRGIDTCEKRSDLKLLMDAADGG